jgi:hypothetical protein
LFADRGAPETLSKPLPPEYVSKITKAHFRRLDLHIFVEKSRRSTTAPVFFVSICKPIQQNCIF